MRSKIKSMLGSIVSNVQETVKEEPIEVVEETPEEPKACCGNCPHAHTIEMLQYEMASMHQTIYRLKNQAENAAARR